MAVRKKIVVKQVENLPSCPHCRSDLDAISGNGMPRPGDYTACYHCHAAGVFIDTKGNFRLATREEVERDIKAGALVGEDAFMMRQLNYYGVS